MTTAKCGFSICKHNSSTKPKEVGICQKDNILLEYREVLDAIHANDYGEDFEGDVETFDTLDCVDFEYCFEKAFN